MKIPKRLKPLYEDGLIDEVLHQLMSGKEATIYIVRCGDHIRCAKVYKAANQRNFKKAAQYTEGRHVRNSRRGRAMAKRTNYGKKEQEELWQHAEVDALYALAHANVRVPKPYGCFDGVLLMELVTDEVGAVAPRLADVELTKEQALQHHAVIMQYIVRMLCAGIIHGDLSEFNVLVDGDGPVIIDLPQAVNAAGNNNARSILTHDIKTITHHYAQYAPELRRHKYAKEIWRHFEKGTLHPDLKLTGHYKESKKKANVDGVLREIKFAEREHEEKLRREAERAKRLAESE